MILNIKYYIININAFIILSLVGSRQTFLIIKQLCLNIICIIIIIILLINNNDIKNSQSIYNPKNIPSL